MATTRSRQRATASPGEETPIRGQAAGKRVYDDGTPFDEVRYLEAKLILKPDRFTSAESFRAFGKIVRRAARESGIGFTRSEEFRKRPKIREVVFFDTPGFDLYRSGYILRRRIAYEDGFPVGDPEIVFKVRHPDEAVATSLDVRPNIGGDYRIKFKAEALPLKDRVGGSRILYSHNCQFGLSQVRESDPASLKTLARVLPPLQRFARRASERVTLVNGGIIEEVLLPIGILDFGRGLEAKCDVALWRTRGEHRPLVGEFAFQLKFDRKEDVARRQRRRCTEFYLALQHELADWLALGVTKTAMVYRLNGTPPQSHE